MEIKQIFLKTRAEFGKQCIFDTWGPHIDEEIRPNPAAMADYITRSHCNVGVLHTRQFALHEAQTASGQTKSSGMFHFEGGWPREINPKDEETTARFRRRVERDDEWAPKLRNLFQQMEHGVLQNGALNIYEQYFDDMVPTELIKPRNLRTLNVYENPQTPARSVNDISWSPDSGNKMVVSYYSELGTQPDYGNIVYIWQIDNPNEPWMTLKATSATLVSEFNPRDPSVLASGLMSGQVCSWDIRTGSTPVQTSHRQFSHRDATTTVKWTTSKSNTEFFSGSMDGRAMWWDTRKLREPTEILVFDLQAPNEPQIDRAIGVSSANFEPSVSAKFMFGLANGVVISGSRKARTPVEKLAWTFDAHHGPVFSVDRNGFNPKIFLTVGDCTARIWTEDIKDSSLVSTRFIKDPVGGCWNKTRHSIFYVTTRTGVLTVWDLLVGLSDPILSEQICEEKLTAIAAHERGDLLAVGNSAGNVFLVESTEALYSFDKNDKNDFSLYLERCSRFVKAIDTRLKEIKLTRMHVTEDESKSVLEVSRWKKKDKSMMKNQNRGKQKMQEMQDKLKSYRKKTRIVKKDKKRLKDEFNDLRITEERFFEIVEKEKLKYEEDELLLRTLKIIPSIKKVVSKKVDKDFIETMDETEDPSKFNDVAAETLAKKIVVPKKTKIVIPATEVKEHVEHEKPMVEESLPPSTEAIVESPTEEISKRKHRKRLMPVAFRLPRPCKVGVCKPDICCRGKLSIRFADRAIRDRVKWIRDGVGEKKRSKDDVGARAPVESKDETRQKKRESWTMFVRAYRRKASSEGTIRSLWEMTELPEELQEAVREAKREIREAERSGGTRMRARKLAKRPLKMRAMAAEKSRKVPRGLQEDEEGYPAKEVMPSSTRTARISAARKGKGAVSLMIDPCTPWKPPSLLEDLQSLLGSPLPESIEEKTNPGMARIKELDAARGRVYPRISDFHSID